MEGQAGDERSRPTVTRVTPTALELHKKKEQDRRATEKQLLARLQTLLFEHRDTLPSAAEITYNYVLECAVTELKNRARAVQGLDPRGDEALAAESGGGIEVSAASAETERHKVKEQLRRARKRALLTQLQRLVLKPYTRTQGGVTGNFILELAIKELEDGLPATGGVGGQ